MDLSTTYLGIELKNPILCGASPLGASLDTIKHLEDAGVAGVVLPSLFEEEIQRGVAAHMAIKSVGEGFSEADAYFPDPDGYHVGPENYLELIAKAKASTEVPIFGSLNGTTAGGWIDYARKIQEAGADALELNIFFLATDPNESGAEVEQRTLDIVAAVKTALSIPVAVKLSPFYSSVANLALKLKKAGADGLVLFNRFYQPDIDIEELDVIPNLRLSTADELRLRLRWLAILHGRVDISLSATGGAHNASDLIKSVMAGAHSVQLVSALLIHGPEHIRRTLEAMEFWMKEHEYASLRQMQGSMSLEKVPNPAAVSRANYMKMLDSWEQ